MTVDALLEAAKQLTPADRIRLVEEVWDTIAADDQEGAITELSAEQRAELDRRLDRLDHQGPTGTHWGDARSRLVGRGR